MHVPATVAGKHVCKFDISTKCVQKKLILSSKRCDFQELPGPGALEGGNLDPIYTITTYITPAKIIVGSTCSNTWQIHYVELL